jgi:PAS domain S-box-containing protein
MNGAGRNRKKVEPFAGKGLPPGAEAELEGLRAELGRRSSELESLRAELAKVRTRERELEDTRSAMLYMLEDVNESARLLTASERRFKHLVESVTDYIYTVRIENGRPVATLHGPGCVAVTGYGPEDYEADPRLWYRMIFEEDRRAVMEQADKLRQRSAAGPLEHRIIRKDGALRWIRNTQVPRYDEQGVLIACDGLISDITERKKLESQLRQAQKMEAVGQLAGGIAHDFNNILAAIIGYGHVLHMKMREDDPLRRNVEHLLEAADRAAHLTRSLLAFSRKQIINPANVDLNEIIQRMGRFLRRIIGEDIELVTSFQQELATVFADSGQLEQVVMNLATNARDAMPRGGRLALDTDTVFLDDAFVRAHGYGKEGWHVRLAVSDTGAGMDSGTLKKIFEPFFTTKEVGKGTGLGLAMVYGIVKQHDGYINVYSEPGNGTTFRIYLPLVREEAAKKRLRPLPSASELPRGAETVLLAEDDDAIRMLHASILSEFGYRVLEAANGTEAVSEFTRNKDRVRLLILDMIMPGKNGREACEEIKKIWPGVKVIFTSGYTADRIYRDGLLEQGTGFLMKPVSPRDLLRKVRETLDA